MYDYCCVSISGIGAAAVWCSTVFSHAHDVYIFGRYELPGDKSIGRAASLGVLRGVASKVGASAALAQVGCEGRRRESRRRLDPTRRSRARNRRPLAMAIRDRAGAYR
jgi:hypothetical protein